MPGGAARPPCVPPEAARLALHRVRRQAGATVAAFPNLWFHTGDAALRDCDGYFYFIDRLGDRIRVRGENLSSFQIEDVLNEHPDIRFCAVLPVPGKEGDEDDIVVFVVPDSSALTEEAVFAYATETMPKCMRPTHVRIVDDIPHTPPARRRSTS
jgi:carnitine-CoA ligase